MQRVGEVSAEMDPEQAAVPEVGDDQLWVVALRKLGEDRLDGVLDEGAGEVLLADEGRHVIPHVQHVQFAVGVLGHPLAHAFGVGVHEAAAVEDRDTTSEGIVDLLGHVLDVDVLAAGVGQAGEDVQLVDAVPGDEQYVLHGRARCVVMGIGNTRGVAMHRPCRSGPSVMEVHLKSPSAVRSLPLKRKSYKRDANDRIGL